MSDGRYWLMTADQIMRAWRPGSTEWSWEDEATDLDSHICPCCGERGHYQASLQENISIHGIHTPVHLGNDGRVWDGHHRIVAAKRLDVPVPVVFA